jgi:two-component system, cell cycle sensor histidine kinase and response regulator CckA
VPYRTLSFEQMIETLHEAIWVLDSDHRVSGCNTRALELLGYSAGEMVGRHVLDFFFPEDVQEMQARLERRRSGQSERYQQRIRRSDGNCVWAQVSARAVMDADRTYVGAIVVITDITASKEAYAALRRSEFWLRQSQRIARLGSYVFDIVADTWTSSETLDEIFGIGSDYVRSAEGWLNLVHPDERDNLRIYLTREVLRRHRPFYLDYRVVRANDQQVRWVQGRGELEFDAAGNPVTLIGTIQDVTEHYQQEEKRRELEARLLQAQKLESLGVLAGGVAHEFNNLLTSILGHADLVLQDLAPGSPAADSVTAIEAAARRAAEISQRLLAYSGRGRFVVGPVGLHGLIREMMRMLELTLSKRATLRADIPEDLPLVDADADQLRQMVMNLVANAAEAMGEHDGVVRISASVADCAVEAPIADYLGDPLEPGRYVVLEVADSGVGFGAETKVRLFDPFFSTKFTGRGLGLAAVLGIVRGHRGAIQVESQPGQGTTFRVFLPALSKAPAASAPPPSANAQPQAASATVLIVDDEQEVRAVALRMVERCGYGAVGAADGQEAVELVREAAARYDCVLLDLTMPRMGGEDALREIRQIAPELPVLLCSGYPAQELTERFAGLGFSGFVQKPYRLAEIRGRLEALFGQR